MRRLGTAVLIGAMVACWPLAGLGQDGLSTDQLKRMYDDAREQLKAAQDRRNELARENEKFKARISQLEKDLEQSQSAANEIADKTYQARAQQGTFAEFLRTNPSIDVQWRQFLQKNLLVTPESSDVLDRDWPLPSLRRVPVAASNAQTRPAAKQRIVIVMTPTTTLPATRPAGIEITPASTSSAAPEIRPTLPPPAAVPTTQPTSIQAIPTTAPAAEPPATAPSTQPATTTTQPATTTTWPTTSQT